MIRNQFYQILILIVIFKILLFHAYAQEYYYYYNEKIFLDLQSGHYIIHFGESVTMKEKETFLTRNGLNFEKEALNSNWILIESMKNEHEINILYDGYIVRGVTSLYTLTEQPLRLTVSDKITLKFFSTVGESQIRMLASEHNLQKIDRTWPARRGFVIPRGTNELKIVFS